MSRLARQIREKIRPRAEQILGIATQLAEDIPILEALSISASTTVIPDDGAAPLEFTNADFVEYLNLVKALQTGYSSIEAIVKAIAIRPIGSILKAYTPSDEPVIDAASALKLRIRPMAAHLQKLKYQFQQDEAILLDNDLLGNATGVINELRDDQVPAITAEQAKAIIAFGAAVIDPSVNTSGRKRAVNAASIKGLG